MILKHWSRGEPVVPRRTDEPAEPAEPVEPVEPAI